MTESTTRTFYLRDIESRGIKLRFDPMLRVDAYTKEDEETGDTIFMYDSLELDIYESETTLYELIDQISSTAVFLWTHYAQEKDENLNGSATRLKQTLLQRLTEITTEEATS